MPLVTRIPAWMQRLYPRGIWRQPGPGSPVYLTFDDGPHAEHTPAIAQILDEAGVPGHFFMNGDNARRHPALVRQLAAAGHVVGCHGARHTAGSRLSAADELENYLHGCALLKDLTGAPVRLVRPPFGRIRAATARALRQRGKRVVLYDVIPYDYRCPGADVIAARTVRAVRDGSIILLHDGGGDRRQTVEAVSVIIRQLGERCSRGRLEPV